MAVVRRTARRERRRARKPGVGCAPSNQMYSAWLNIVFTLHSGMPRVLAVRRAPQHVDARAGQKGTPAVRVGPGTRDGLVDVGVEDGEAREKMGAAGRQRLLDRFSLGKHLDRVTGMYESAIERWRG